MWTQELAHLTTRKWLGRIRGSRWFLQTTAALAGSALLLLPAAAGAQAWTADKGNLSFGVGYLNNWNTKHYLPTGGETDAGHTRSQVVALGLSYALTDRFAVSARVPYVQAAYHGARPHPGTIDNGDYHGTVTNLGLELRYQAVENPLAVTPFVAAGYPMHDYVTLGHAAPGKGLEEYTVGFYAGRSLDEWIPRTYFQTRYGYTFAEKVAGISHDRHNADLEIGYFLTNQLGLRAIASWQETLGGIPVPIPPTHPLFRYHDQLGAEGFLNLGAGLSYSLTHKVDVYAVYAESVKGRNGHKLDHGLSTGVTWSCHCAFRQVGEQLPAIHPRNR